MPSRCSRQRGRFALYESVPGASKTRTARRKRPVQSDKAVIVTA